MKSLKNKIYKQNGILIITIVLILESIFILGVRNYYIGSVKQELLNKANISGEFYNRYLINKKMVDKAKYILENESNEKYIYMQILDVNKNLLIDSNGLNVSKISETYDIEMGLQGKSIIRSVKDEYTNNQIMSVSVPLYRGNNISGILRYVVSIEEIEKTLSKMNFISVLTGVFVIIFSFILSSILASGIITPVKELTITAESMAKGDFSKRVSIKNNDEIGKLSGTLNYMADEIVKNNSVKNEFISSVSHELRTPLTAIKGWSEIILTGEVDSYEDIKDGVKIISDETERLMGLVEELLDFSKFESGRITLKLEKLDINDLVLQVCNYFKKRFEDGKLEVKLNLHSEFCVVNGDVNRLKQVLINIIDNAVKFSNVDGEININTLKKEKSVLIEIIDNGIGIPFDDINKVTEKFYKGKSNRSGSGIGLAICKEIIKMHGGYFKIESEEKKGTKVIIEILTEL